MNHNETYIKQQVWPQFQVIGECVSVQPYGSGHINDTYLVCGSAKEPRYILQKINHTVFTDPRSLMDNVLRVTEHIRSKLIAMGQKDMDRRVLTVIRTTDGAGCFKDEWGTFWRLYLFIEKSKTHDVVESLDQAYQAAKAFGQFQGLLSDLPEPPLHETISDFHHGPKRFRAFVGALKADSHHRAKEVKAEIDFLQNHGVIFDRVYSLIEKGELPLRVTHNDTKINNVMLDMETGEGLCVIDLDTVMPGSILYDFGDIVRTSTCLAAEDEADLSKVSMDISYFDAIVRGYLSSAGNFMNETERGNLILGGKYITLIMGTRFLTDYLSGDIYYKVHRDHHNRDRVRTQFKLVQSLEDQESQMRSLVEKYM
jgi:hypothetical protein